MKEKKYKSIIKNKDEKGNILTYTVIMDDLKLEYNTLKEAKLMARVVE